MSVLLVQLTCCLLDKLMDVSSSRNFDYVNLRSHNTLLRDWRCRPCGRLYSHWSDVGRLNRNVRLHLTNYRSYLRLVSCRLVGVERRLCLNVLFMASAVFLMVLLDNDRHVRRLMMMDDVSHWRLLRLTSCNQRRLESLAMINYLHGYE